MLTATSSAARVRSAPPAIENTCGDREYDDECEPAARSVEKSFGSAFPTSQPQAEQPKNASNAYSDQGILKG